MPSLPPILRPRWTWKYAVSSLAVLYFTYCILTGQPFFSSDLPLYTGLYDVGTIDIEAPRDPHRVDNVNYKSGGNPAFELETVLFTVYYPIKKGVRSARSYHPWFPRPISLTAQGYLRLGHLDNFVTTSILSFLLWIVAGGRKIPAEVDAPLFPKEGARPAKSYDELRSDKAQYPVILFSHGDISSRTDYNWYLGQLAAQGYIVAALEHRDGSCPGTSVMTPKDGQHSVFPLKPSDLTREGAPLDRAAFKQIQLAYRSAELEAALDVLRMIDSGKGDAVRESNPRHEGATLADWAGRLDFSQIIVAGHSFGGTGALRALKPNTQIPATGGIVLDPGKSSGQLNTDIDVPLLVVHSNSWSKQMSIFFGRPHFDVVKELVLGVVASGKDAWFMTSKGTSHPSVTDAPLLEPTLLSWATSAKIDAREGVRQYVKVSLEFLDYLKTGKRQGILKEKATHPTYDDDVRSDRRKEMQPDEIEKYWQVHVAPE
jgi:platelet-activating factor acetylhydrolase